MGSVRAVLAAAGAIALGAAAGSAGAGGVPKGLRVTCPQKTFLVAFSPRGTATERRPHITLYTRREPLATVLPSRVAFGRTCKAKKDATATWGGGASKTTGKRSSLRCRIPSAPTLRGAPFLGPTGTYAGDRLVAMLGSHRKAFLVALIKKAGSKLRYSTRYCKRR
jgi:hypothetical protein